MQFEFKNIYSFVKIHSWQILTGILLALLILELKNTQISSSMQDGFSNAANKSIPSVVNIYTLRIKERNKNTNKESRLSKFQFTNDDKNRKSKINRSLGSGVIVSNDGYILTNYHVIKNADRIEVMLLDGRQKLAKVIGKDEPTDIAVLKIDLGNLKPISFADPNSVEIGNIVLAIGNPYGIGQTVSQGIVSATGRYGLNINMYEKYIQTDAAINSGNSGGALINIHGDLIGINSGFYSKTGGSNGIGFAIPTDIANYVFKNIIKNGKVIRGWIGVIAEEITPSLSKAFNLNTIFGLYITGVKESSPAENSGLKPGDIITHINHKPITNGNQSMHKIAELKPGTEIITSIISQGVRRNVNIEVGIRP